MNSAEPGPETPPEVRVVLQYFDGCPGWQVAAQRLTEALKQVTAHAPVVHLEKVSTLEEAERLGFGGSPTILIDGVDLFSDTRLPAGYACRIYMTESGPQSAPSLNQLTARLTEFRHHD